ncbi:uncharacterized protein LOC115182211 isoform X3 [Salmo trutta]|uniref:uncharacterized protein LOC115182211 isoform X3 n=1 Tax=Salmo trutta TaxID=8032 RepID=UPI0011324A9F|nr:uncharacterized protein LOC115182211 isoform X3 [Salmo trutta]
MSLLSHSPPVKEEVFWTEKGTIVKDEKEEEAVTVKKEVKGEAVTVKEDEDVFRVKEEDKEDDVAVTVKEEEDVFGVKGITVTLEEEEAEKTGDLINSKQYSQGDFPWLIEFQQLLVAVQAPAS